jgi:hypothetical protein
VCALFFRFFMESCSPLQEIRIEGEDESNQQIPRYFNFVLLSALYEFVREFG